MKTSSRSMQRIIEDQFKKWKADTYSEKGRTEPHPVITISREPGSGGGVVAEKLSEKINFDLFHQRVIHEMSKSAKTSSRLLATLDEKGLNTLENWISSMVDDQHLWPDQYLQHLMKVVGAISRHGKAIIVGRGANFITPPKGRFRVRVIAPLEARISHVAKNFSVSYDVAKRRILQTESDRRAFIRKYFHADISDPQNYDMVLNTGTLTLDDTIDIIKTAFIREKSPHTGIQIRH